MMHIILFIIYFFLLCVAVTRWNFFRGLIKTRYLLLLFATHVAIGCLHNWIAFHFFPSHGDIWSYFTESIEMKEEMLTRPINFTRQLLSNKDSYNIADGSKPMLDIQYQLMKYINVLLDFPSFNNFYINTLLFTFPVFAGTIALFKALYAAFDNLLPALSGLLLPSVLFWTSVIHKDSFFYMMLGCLLYFISRPHSSLLRKIIVPAFYLLLIIVSKANALMTLAPALFFFMLAEKKRLSRKMSFTITIATVMIALFIVNLFINGGILLRITERQNEFQELSGGSKMYLPPLQPTLTSFLAVFPSALINGFFQPLPGTGGKPLYLFFSIELLLTWALVFYGCWLCIKNKTFHSNNAGIACLLFALPGMLVTGYLIPFAGAIIRYRSIYLPFLLAPVINIICNYRLSAAMYLNNWLQENIMTNTKGLAPAK